MNTMNSSAWSGVDVRMIGQVNLSGPTGFPYYVPNGFLHYRIRVTIRAYGLLGPFTLSSGSGFGSFILHLPLYMDSTDSLSCASTTLENLDINSDLFSSKDYFSPTKLTVNSGNLTRHSKYYFDDTMSVFLVGDKLFKVHRHFLARESEVFRWMFESPEVEGGSDTNPIILSGVRLDEFESLLDFFYNGMHVHLGIPTNPIQVSRRQSQNPLINSPPQHLFNLLSISTRYDFERIRKYAIDEIQRIVGSLDPIDVILVGEKYDIFHWIAPALAKLCQRERPLTIEEARKLGFETAILVAEAREMLYEVHTKIKRSEVQYDVNIVSRILEEIFFKFDKAGDRTGPRTTSS